jgi:hypothetical protein
LLTNQGVEWIFMKELVPPHGLEVKPFLRVRFAQPLSVLHTSRTAVSISCLGDVGHIQRDLVS